MKLLFSPETDELTVTHTKGAIHIHLESYSGDTFIIELDESTTEHLLSEVLKAAWLMNHNHLMSDTGQKTLPF